jgi:HD-like signal output (HDOD) protein
MGWSRRGNVDCVDRVNPKQDGGRDERNARLRATLREGLPHLPSYVFELNFLLSQAPVDLKRVSQVIHTDPTLTAQVLRVCNSAALGWQGRIIDIEEAVILLGSEQLRAFALTGKLMAYAERRLPAASLQAFWQHSLLVALLGERLARWTGYYSPEEAYLGGLLHDIGTLPLLVVSFAERKHGEAWEFGDWQGTPAGEREHFGLDHGSIGRSLGVDWNFPASLLEVFEFHHKPERAVADPRLVRIVAAADQFCQRHGVALGGKLENPAEFNCQPDTRLLQSLLPGLDDAQGAHLARSLETEFVRVFSLANFGSRGFLGAALPGEPVFSEGECA